MILSAPRRLRIYDCNNDICTQVTLPGDIVTSASARHTHYRYIGALSNSLTTWPASIN